LRGAFGIGQVVTTESFVEALHKGEGAMGVLRQELAGVPVRSAAVGDEIELGDGVVLEVLSPGKGATFDDVNDSSLVGLVKVPTTHGFKRVLLTGDIEDAGIESVRTQMERRSATGIDVLELPHHGSARARAVEFVLWLDPPIVVQSTGASRAFDARWRSVRPGREWFSTAEVGAVRVEISKEGEIDVQAVRGRD
jgi:competence protein ComEC